MAVVIDYHARIRDAEADVLKGLDLGIAVYAVDDLDELDGFGRPFVAVACVGPEQDRPGFGTNRQDGIGYPVAVGLFSSGVVNGAKTPGATDLTLFRRKVHVAFHLLRLTAVPQVAYCEVDGNSRIFDPQDPRFQALSTELVVTAVGRFPRA